MKVLSFARFAAIVVALAIGSLTCPSAMAKTEAAAQAGGDAAKTAGAKEHSTEPSKPIVSEQTTNLVFVVTIGIIVIGFGSVVIGLGRSRGDDRARPWRLSDALSEEVTFVNASGTSETQLVASSSRLIAMLGVIAILSFFVSISLIVLYAFAAGGVVPDVVDTVMKFLVGAAGLFVPYFANQLRAALEKKPAAATPVAQATTSGAGTIQVPQVPPGRNV